jgi:hypothetical protein
MRFNLDIEIGNDAMLTAEDVAMALEATAKRLRMYSVDEEVQMNIRDANGQRVGFWELYEE